jgi:hypothetical protein
MRLMLELGRRIHLQSMDSHCSDITIGLYEHLDEGGKPRFQLHSYSALPGTAERLAFLATAMVKLGGMEAVPGPEPRVRWPCRERHVAATRRVFIEVCKLARPDQLTVRPSRLDDPKLPGVVTVTGDASGRYTIAAENGVGGEARLKAICAGYLKLAEMERWEETETGVRFACGHRHDALMGLLLYRALNARAALRETEMMATRGVLVAPSAQAQAT